MVRVRCMQRGAVLSVCICDALLKRMRMQLLMVEPSSYGHNRVDLRPEVVWLIGC
jgi:hypothetical protein